MSSNFIFETPAGSLFDYTAFIEEGYESQQKNDNAAGRPGPFDEVTPEQRFAKVIEYLGHMIEETIEARVYVPRRTWKNNEPSYLDNEKMREEFVAEMFDILLFHRAVLAYAGISAQEFAEISARKMNYNSKRKDHNVNGDEPVVQNPAAELQGICPSANF
jgi:hypothetical protein